MAVAISVVPLPVFRERPGRDETTRCDATRREARLTGKQGMDYLNVSDIGRHRRIESIPASLSSTLQVRAFINPQKLSLFLFAHARWVAGRRARSSRSLRLPLERLLSA